MEPHWGAEPFSYPGELFDKLLHAASGRLTGMLSPMACEMAFADWMIHIANSPLKQWYLWNKFQENQLKLINYYFQYLKSPECDLCVAKQLEDKRFNNPLWKKYPYNLYAQAFLLNEQLWEEASRHTRGIAKHRQEVLNFAGRQFLDMLCPANFPWTNPEVIAATQTQGGMNFVDGFSNFLDDMQRYYSGQRAAGTENFQVGKRVAITPGKVVYKNNLIELIQYQPTTAMVKAQPLLIVPAWIMKYYILDLSPHNSLVKFLVDKGHTVFMISWKNPNKGDSHLGLDDYTELGILKALEAMNTIVPGQKIHAVGYCMGATLLMIAAAYLAGKSDDRLQTISLFAGQIDFKEAGELLLFVDESQVSYLEDVMWAKGYLDGAHMAGTFNMLRSVDLIWSRMIKDYLLGKRESLNDLMAWNKDTTHLPYKMHSEYLRKLFLNNDLVQGRFKVNNKKVSLLDINAPFFSVSTITDHIAPWKSVYKIHLFTKNEVTFVLTVGGHNAGIISEPGHAKRSFQMHTRNKGDKYIPCEKWHEIAPHFEGSWWIQWQQWLANHSSTEIPPPAMGAPNQGYPILGDAPGLYVLQN